MAKITITKNQFDAVTKLKDTVMNDGGSSGATGKVESSGNTAKDELKKTISDLDTEYKNSPVRTYGDIEVPLTKEKVYEMPSDEEIKKKAEEQVAPIYDAKMNTITSEGQLAQKGVESEKDELYKRAEESLKELRKSFNRAKENTSNEAVKRGLARSSIVLNQLSDLENSLIGATGGVLEQREKSLTDLADKIEELKLKVLNQTNELNAEKAQDISEKVKDLFDEYKKEEQEVFEYNNRIKKEKADAIAKLKAAGMDMNEKNTKEYAKMMSGKFKAFYKYYYSLGDDALSEMQKDREYILENIGDDGYNGLLRYFEK